VQWVQDSGCHYQPGSDGLVIQADLVLPDGVLAGGAVWIREGIIRCAGCACGTAESARLQCKDAVLSPALLNPHDHLGFAEAWPATDTGERYAHRHEWRKGKNGKTKIPVAANKSGAGAQWGELRQLLAGTAGIAGSSKAPGLLRNLDQERGLEGLGHAVATTRTFPLGDSSGTLAASGCDAYNADGDASSGAAYVPHVAEGTSDDARNEFSCVVQNHLAVEGSAWVHGIGLFTRDVLALAEGGVGLVWSPRSNTRLYDVTAAAQHWLQMGAPVALGTDWSASGSIHLLREAACARAWNAAWGQPFDDAALVAMMTRDAARVLGFGDALGRIGPFRTADLTLWRRRGTAYASILDAAPEDVWLVLRGGVALYGRADLVEVLRPGCETLDVCGALQAVCLQEEVGSDMEALRARVGDAYDLFFCDEPVDEPSCAVGRPRPGDTDGDGIDEGVDNCPQVFNPMLPIHRGQQQDSDGDGAGDACDPQPL
jgi:hypothetical protein